MCALRTGFFDGDRGGLEGGERRCLFLHLRLSSKKLRRYLLVGVVLQLHLVLKISLALPHRLQNDILIGISKLRITLTRLIITRLGLGSYLTVVLQIDTGLTGAVVCDELLQTGLDRVGHVRTNHCILIRDIDGDDHRLLVDIADNILIDGLDNLGLILGQTKRIDFFVHLFFLALEDAEKGLHTSSPPRGLLFLTEIVVVTQGAVFLTFFLVAFNSHRDRKQTGFEVH